MRKITPTIFVEACEIVRKFAQKKKHQTPQEILFEQKVLAT